MNQIISIEEKITKSVEYNYFVENNPDLKDKIDKIIIDFVEWKKNKFYGSSKTDFCYSSGKSMPYSDSWSVDEPADFGTPKYLICKTWERFERQMGTTSQKFELTDDESDIKALRLIGEIFEKIGFKVFVVTFTHWRVGYDFEFVKLGDVEGEIITPTKNNQMHSVRICISSY